MKRTGSILWGLFLIALGLLFFADMYYNFDLLNMTKLWPLFILIPGLIFEISYFVSGKNPGLLVPGGILIIVGLIFLTATLIDWSLFKYTMTLFPLSVAFGLFQLYIFGGRHPSLLIPVGILGVISIVSFFSVILSLPFAGTLAPVVLIAVGLLIIFGRRK